MSKTNDPNRLITLAIHTYDQAVTLKNELERAGIEAVLHNVNLEHPVVSSGVRVRICEKDLPQALKVVEGASSSSSRRSRLKSHVVIPVDFSPFSMKACKVGFEYASKADCSVILLHAFMSERYRFFMPFGSDRYDNGERDDEESVKAKAIEKMKQFRSRVEEEISKGNLCNVMFQTKVVEGLPEEKILECATDNDAKLIVMGTHGNNRHAIASLGSVTAEVLDAGRFPIFTIPKNLSLEDLSSIHHVVFFSTLNQRDILSFDMFSKLMRVKGKKVSIIPVVERKNRAMAKKASKQFLQYCNDHYPENEFTIENISIEGDNLSAFEQFVAENHVDLIAIPDKKKSVFTRLFNPSIAHRVLLQSELPMLVVPV